MVIAVENGSMTTQCAFSENTVEEHSPELEPAWLPGSSYTGSHPQNGASYTGSHPQNGASYTGVYPQNSGPPQMPPLGLALASPMPIADRPPGGWQGGQEHVSRGGDQFRRGEMGGGNWGAQ
ncbi:hypothetical protein T484DRAFT_1847526, partial [Baffinella frigidus]